MWPFKREKLNGKDEEALAEAKRRCEEAFAKHEEVERQKEHTILTLSEAAMTASATISALTPAQLAEWKRNIAKEES